MNFETVEKARVAYAAKQRAAKITALVVFLISLLIAIITMRSASGIVFALPIFAPLFAYGIASIFASKPYIAYRRAYKAYFVEQTMQKTFTNLHYDHTKGLDKNLLRQTGMINTGDRYSADDLTIAKYKNVALAQSDAHIEEEHTDSEGHTSYTTIFRGRIMLFEFPKKFNFKLELIGRRFTAYQVPGKNPTTGRKMSKMQTESGEFNRSFRIYGEDGFETFYILDPAFMVKIDAISDRYQNNILFGFLENKLLIALNNGKDSFEPPRKASVPLIEQVELAKVTSDIKIITDFVDQLSLDRKLFQS
ncbi:DUF3137 domain-containing protein [Candidatus Saccharibacteria bacterium]|nr:DUF3137 domain-containing protein [Candidatus Saccharibacteria bacterium]